MQECPVHVGQRFMSLRSKERGEVIETQWFRETQTFAARLRMDGHRVRWVMCSKGGIKGYRRIEG